MITIETVRIIKKKAWQNFFKQNKSNFKNYSEPCFAKGYLELTRYINIQSMTPDLKTLLDDFIFDYLSFEQMNTHIIDKIEINQPKENSSLKEYFEGIHPLINADISFFDEDIIDKEHEENKQQLLINTDLNDMQIFSIENMPCLLKSEINYDRTTYKINDIIMLFKMKKSTHRNEPKNIYLTLTLDFNNQVFDIGYQAHLLEQYSNIKFEETMKIFKDYFIEKFNIMNIKYSVFDEDNLKRILFLIFSSISSPIEEALYETLPDNIEELIGEFLQQFNIQLNESSIQQFEAIIFQSYADMNNNVFVQGLYNNGHIFRFGYVENNDTRIISRNDNRDPIYTSPIYWSIKKLIYDAERIFTLGVTWPIIDEEGNLFENAVKVDIINSKIQLYFYTADERKLGRRRLLDAKEKIINLL